MESITYSDVIKSHEKDLWFEAMNDEIDSMKRNNVWELCDLPKKRKVIGCKWVFKKKLRVDGSIDKFKARLVAKGYTQKEGLLENIFFSSKVCIYNDHISHCIILGFEITSDGC